VVDLEKVVITELVDQEDQVVVEQMINHQIQKELEVQVLVVKVMMEEVQHQEDLVQITEELVVVVEKTLLDQLAQDVVVELVEQEFQFQVVLVDHQ
jgi:hypothetical protein